MSRTIALLILVAALALAPRPAAPADLKEIEARGTLRVLTSVDEEPEMFNFGGSGEPGFEREMIEGFAKLHHLKIESVSVARFEDIIPRLLKGEGDTITGIIDTEARRKLIDFTVEVFPARHVVVTYKPHKALNTIEELKQEKVGVVKGTSWAAAVTTAGVPASQVQAFPDRVALLEALRSDKITATAMSLSDLTLAMRRQPMLQPGMFLGTPSSAGWGVSKSDTALKAALNEYLSDARRGQTWSRLVVKYFGQDALGVLGRASKQ